MLSKTGAQAIAGVVALLPELMVDGRPPIPTLTVALGPGNWAPTTATWGVGNYSCALRVVLTMRSRPGWSCGFPVPTRARTIASPCSSALRSGASRNASTRPRRSSRPLTVVLPNGGPALPRDLDEAADRFESSAAARKLFGPAFVEHYAAARRAEAAACHRFVSTEERERYVDYV